MYKFTLFLFCCMSLPLSAQQLQYSRAKVFLEGHSLNELARLDVDVDHCHSDTEGVLISDFSELELRQLAQAGIRYEVQIADVQEFYQKQNTQSLGHVHSRSSDCGPGDKYQTPQNFKLGSMGGYPTYAEMLAILDEMQQLYPQLITKQAKVDENIVTHEGRSLYYVKISDNPDIDEEEPEILYNGLIHAREANSQIQLLFYMWYLLENYDTDPEVKYLLDHSELYFIPCLNPDGYVQNETTHPNGGGLWRKNKRDNNNNGVFDPSEDGVDLNRNFGHFWGYNDTGSSGNISSNTYRGDAPFSEPETQILRNFCIQREFKMAMNYHNRGNFVIHPFNYRNLVVAPAFTEMGKALTRESRFKIGTAIQTLGYEINGGVLDWMYGDSTEKAPINCFLPEVGNPIQGFWPHMDDIIPMCKHTVHQNLTAAHLTLIYGELYDEAPPTLSQQAGAIPYRLYRYGLQDGSITVRLTGLSDNVESTGAAQAYDLAHLENVLDSISYTLKAGIREGERVKFLLEWDNGLYQSQDTLRLHYSWPSVLSDAADNLDNWTVRGNFSNWGVTTDDYHTAPSSFTNPIDNSFSTYGTEIISAPVSLVDAESAILEFWTKYDIRFQEGYTQLSVALPYYLEYEAQCGLYTSLSDRFSPAPPDQPIYQGRRTNWVKEKINLKDYLGEEILIRFEFIPSRFFGENEYFYFDDVEVRIVKDGEVAVHSLSADDFSFDHPQPNPADQYVDIDLPPLPAGSATLVVYDALGRLHWQQSLSTLPPTLRLSTADWPIGLYFYQLEQDARRTPAQRLVIKH